MDPEPSASFADHNVPEDVQRMLQSERLKLQASIRKANALATELANAHKEIKAAKAEAARAATMLSNSAKALQMEEQNCRVLQLDKDTLSHKVKELSDELQVARLDVGVKLSTIASMQSQYDKLQVSLQKSQREEKLAAKTVSEAHAESAALRMKMLEVQASLTAAETAHSQAQEALLNMTVERDDLKEAVTTLRRRIRDLETAGSRSASEMEELAATNAARDKAFAELQLESTTLRDTLATMRKAVAGHEERSAATSAELADLRARVTVAEAAVATSDANAARVAVLEEELATEREKVDELTSQRNSAVRKMESLQQDLKKVHVSMKQDSRVEELEQANEQLTLRVQRLMAERSQVPWSASGGMGGGVPAPSPPRVVAPSPPLSAAPGALGGSGVMSPSRAGAAPSGGRPRSGSSSVKSLLKFRLKPGTGSHHASTQEMHSLELQRLANELADQLHDRETALSQQRSTKEILAARIGELEAELARYKGQQPPGDSCGAGASSGRDADTPDLVSHQSLSRGTGFESHGSDGDGFGDGDEESASESSGARGTHTDEAL